MGDPVRRGIAAALAAAALFGASAPLVKLLLRHGGVLSVSALLYAGAAAALTVVVLTRRRPSAEAQLRREDARLLLAVTVLGGVVGPWLLLVGLRHVSGIAGSLLLNLEGPFTLLFAVALFGEHASRRLVVAAALIFGGAVVLEYEPSRSGAATAGALAIAGACAAWALDNNLTQRLALRDPVRVVQAKAAGAAVASGLLAAVSGSRFPELPMAAATLAVGATCYGSSIVLDVWALRLLGAARESALFALGPFVGAVVAVPLLDESVRAPLLLAAGVMAVGVVLLLREQHEHDHTHRPIVHDHGHAHDVHHDHAHDDGHLQPVEHEHSHLHRHDPLEHAHPHVSDAHHRHEH